MRVLVIGGTSFIGPYVVRELVTRSHEVTLFHRGQSQADLPIGVAQLFGNREALPQYAETLRALRPDVVLDMIAFSRHDGRTLMETFRGAAGRVVAVSSIDVYKAYDIPRIGVDP